MPVVIKFAIKHHVLAGKCPSSAIRTRFCRRKHRQEHFSSHFAVENTDERHFPAKLRQKLKKLVQRCNKNASNFCIMPVQRKIVQFLPKSPPARSRAGSALPPARSRAGALRHPPDRIRSLPLSRRVASSARFRPRVLIMRRNYLKSRCS